jgi:hypothetical protein
MTSLAEGYAGGILLIGEGDALFMGGKSSVRKAACEGASSLT